MIYLSFNKTIFNDRFLKIKAFIVMGITLGHKYRLHVTTENQNKN